jgi:hypothetical protein
VQERSLAQIAGFQDMIDLCGLDDLCYEGPRLAGLLRNESWAETTVEYGLIEPWQLQTKLLSSTARVRLGNNPEGDANQAGHTNSLK